MLWITCLTSPLGPVKDESLWDASFKNMRLVKSCTCVTIHYGKISPESDNRYRQICHGIRWFFSSSSQDQGLFCSLCLVSAADTLLQYVPFLSPSFLSASSDHHSTPQAHASSSSSSLKVRSQSLHVTMTFHTQIFNRWLIQIHIFSHYFHTFICQWHFQWKSFLQAHQPDFIWVISIYKHLPHSGACECSLRLYGQEYIE